MDNERAHAIALMAITYIVADEAAREGLLRMTGLSPAALRDGLEDPQVLAGVLGFLLANEPRLLTFCEEAGLAPESPAVAFRYLSGEYDV